MYTPHLSTFVVLYLLYEKSEKYVIFIGMVAMEREKDNGSDGRMFEGNIC